jgi:hypothetical protein
MDLRKNNKGLTLVEVLISLVILIILISTFSGAVLVSLKSESTSNNLDFASSMSASIFDYLSDANNLKVIVENEVDMSSGEYKNEIRDFIKNDLETSLKDNFLAIYNNYTENNRFDYLDKSKIIITDRSDIIDGLYEVEINIYWYSEQGEGKYEIATMIGVD